jgi:hypothetical protein
MYKKQVSSNANIKSNVPSRLDFIISSYVNAYDVSLLFSNANLFNAFMIGIPVMYISMLPFSVGGWGLRENSMIIGFTIIGLSSEIALSVSIILGLSLLIASIPGIVVFWEKAERLTSEKGIEGDVLINI